MAATTALVSVDEYLNTTYQPDVDYVDGRIEERNLGEFDHADLQTQIAMMLRMRQKEWGVRVVVETRVQVAPTRFRIPDVCVLRGDAARERVVREAPLLCVEVLSPRDSLKAMRRRVEGFFAMGVPEVWIFDPAARTAYVLRGGEVTEHPQGVFRLDGSPVELSLLEVFATLDA